jgi:hypothetical protein
MEEKIITFPGQYNSFRVTTTGDRIISFRIDEMYADKIKDIVSVPMGTEFVVNLVNVTGDTNLSVEEESSTVKERFWNKMHGLLGQLSELKKSTPEQTKEYLKDWLKEKKYIKESTKELDLRGLAVACNYLEEQIKQCLG